MKTMPDDLYEKCQAKLRELSEKWDIPCPTLSREMYDQVPKDESLLYKLDMILTKNIVYGSTDFESRPNIEVAEQMLQNPEALVNFVIPHEFGHVVVFHKYGKALALRDPHGAAWQKIMKQMGFTLSQVTNKIPGVSIRGRNERKESKAIAT